MAESPEKKAVYFGSLTVEGVKCFKGKETLDLTNEDGKPAMLTVILGNNGTGKTTLLTCLLGMMPTPMPKALNGTKEQLDAQEGEWVFPFRALYTGFPTFIGTTYIKYLDAIGGEIGKLGEGRLPFAARTLESDAPALDYPLTSEELLGCRLFAYGAGRHMGKGELVDNPINLITFFHDDRLINAHEYLARLDYGRKLSNMKAEEQFGMIERLVASVIPEILKFTGKTNDQVQNFIEVETLKARISLNELSLGYKTMLALIIDIAKKMIDHYPESLKPFEESAIILIDEVDLHLHPSWQQRILNDLTTHFPNIQFIVSSHSPLVLQSAKKVNLAVLHSTDNGVTIRNYKDTTFSGWSPEEILHDLMELDHTHSDLFGELMRKFKDAVIDDKYLEAKALFDKLDKILHPNNVTRRLLKLDLASLTPPEVA